MSLAESPQDPWAFLRSKAWSGHDAIRLVVHGRSEGLVSACITEFVARLQRRREAPVELEVLTADHSSASSSGSLWLIPLLLLPGSHVRIDLPLIRRRLIQSYSRVTLLPFLGAWPAWWTLVSQDLQQARFGPNTTLIHHPLRSGVAERFLSSLSRRLGCPLTSFEDWPDYRALHPEASPFPLVLAPNRLSAEMSPPSVTVPLLERPLLRDGLIDLLAALP
jgi:hypothetical protein